MYYAFVLLFAIYYCCFIVAEIMACARHPIRAETEKLAKVVRDETLGRSRDRDVETETTSLEMFTVITYVGLYYM
jgi:hypothetical protein